MAQPPVSQQYAVSPWTGAEIPNGTRIGLRTTQHFIGLTEDGNGIETFSGAVTIVPFRWAGGMPFQWDDASPILDYVIAADPPANAGSVFTLWTLPRAGLEQMSANDPERYQTIILQVEGAGYVSATEESYGVYTASADQGNANVLSLDLTSGDSALLSDLLYTFDQRSGKAQDPDDIPGYAPNFVQPADSPLIILQYSQGGTATPMKILILTPVPGSAAADGTRLRDAVDGRIYLFLDGVMRHIPNPTTFENLFADWSSVIGIADGTTYAVGAPLTDGAYLAKGTSDGRVFLMTDGMRRWIADTYVEKTRPGSSAFLIPYSMPVTSPVFNRFGFDSYRIREVATADLEAVPEGPTLC